MNLVFYTWKKAEQTVRAFEAIISSVSCNSDDPTLYQEAVQNQAKLVVFLARERLEQLKEDARRELEDMLEELD
jgi:hypothetical protein